MTHDYKRNGTTTLFAALNVKTGEVIGECLPRHMDPLLDLCTRRRNPMQVHLH
jgi:hypothetical protein